MKEFSAEELNKIAMQIILHAGDSRALMGEVIDNLVNGNEDEVNAKMKEARSEIVEAHRLQTDVIQSTIDSESCIPTLLFTHAQDTLMTVNSELYIVEYLVKLYRGRK